jgi:NADPH:quinone reductase-like Zn-dependent oxidoreductase
MLDDIPEKMRAVVLREYHEEIADAIGGLRVLERPVPRPRRGQVLVKIAAAPCNPSDLLLLQGKYGTLKTLPTVPGWEGAGTVVATGGGLLGRWLVGKRVACAVRSDRDGTWAEYVVVNSNNCIALKSAVPIEQGASLIVNPLTSLAMLETARKAGHQAAVHTVGACQLGRMMIAMAADVDFPLINVVRREAQAQIVRSLGATHVLNSTSERFGEELKLLCERLRATAAFEAIAGEMDGNCAQCNAARVDGVCVRGVVAGSVRQHRSDRAGFSRQNGGRFLPGQLARSARRNWNLACRRSRAADDHRRAD